MVDFCGWDMPVIYQGVVSEHNACRNQAALFDVSHMGQVRLTGKDREKFIQQATPVSLTDVGLAKLSVIMNKEGGLLDDTLITPFEDRVDMVINAGNIEKDLDHLRAYAKEINADVHIDYRSDQGLLALQGPTAQSILAKTCTTKDFDLSKIPFMHSFPLNVLGLECFVTRCGYTGEDGFEISVAGNKVEELAEGLLANGASLAGLGARDSLRLEAGLCLYGPDMDETTSLVEAGLIFVVAKKRRTEGGFLGADRVQKDIKEGTSRKRVGFIVDGKAPARPGTKVLAADGTTEIGHVTSGCPSPTLGKPIGVGFLNTPVPKVGSAVNLLIRNKTHPATVAKLPFVPSNYYRVK